MILSLVGSTWGLEMQKRVWSDDAGVLVPCEVRHSHRSAHLGMDGMGAASLRALSLPLILWAILRHEFLAKVVSEALGKLGLNEKQRDVAASPAADSSADPGGVA